MYNILIVDDISKNIQVLGGVLQDEEYAISFATSGNQALEMIQEENYDLVLLDVMMPGMDGFEVCERIKAIPEKENIPIIFLTARIEQKDISYGFAMGAVDYIAKPFNSSELKARVKTHLSLKKSQDRVEQKNLLLQQANNDLEKLNKELQESLETIRQLEGIIPICSFCKSIRDDKGYWEQLEKYLSKRSEVQFSHGLCPDCLQKHYPSIK